MFVPNADVAVFAPNAGVAVFAPNAGVAVFCPNAGVVVLPPNEKLPNPVSKNEISIKLYRFEVTLFSA